MKKYNLAQNIARDARSLAHESNRSAMDRLLRDICPADRLHELPLLVSRALESPSAAELVVLDLY